jgi:hypothetical protein
MLVGQGGQKGGRQTLGLADGDVSNVGKLGIYFPRPCTYAIFSALPSSFASLLLARVGKRVEEGQDGKGV